MGGKIWAFQDPGKDVFFSSSSKLTMKGTSRRSYEDLDGKLSLRGSLLLSSSMMRDLGCFRKY